MSSAKVYPLYVQKVERQNRTRAEVDEVIRWLTGYDQNTLEAQVAKEVDFRTFFAEAPQFNFAANKITGKVCGVNLK